MFIPNSPRPPSGMAHKEGRFKARRKPPLNLPSYHSREARTEGPLEAVLGQFEQPATFSPRDISRGKLDHRAAHGWGEGDFATAMLMKVVVGGLDFTADA